MAKQIETLNFVFDAFPSPEGARFIDIEDGMGCSLSYGDWAGRADGLVALVIPDHRALLETALVKLDEINDPEDDQLYEIRQQLRDALVGFRE